MNGSGTDIMQLILLKLLLISVLIISAGTVHAQNNTYLKPELQVILFQKIFKYMNSVEQNKKPKILVIYQQGTTGLKETINAFRDEGFTANSTDKSEFESVITNYQILYLMPGVSLGNKKEIPAKNKVLTITGDPYLVAAGDAAVGVGIENSKPAIYLNLSTVKAQNHEVSTDLINLAKIYR